MYVCLYIYTFIINLKLILKFDFQIHVNVRDLNPNRNYGNKSGARILITYDSR